MEIPTAVKALKFRHAVAARPRPSFFVTGQPGVGKTLLLAELALKLTGATAEDILIGEFPLDEEGAETLRDRPFTVVKLPTMEALEQTYQDFLKIKPPAVIMDNLPAAWWMAFMCRCPDGLMPEDHGKTWNKLASDVCHLTVTRFKAAPWVKFFGASSLVSPTEDAFIVAQDSPKKGPKDEKLQTTLPGQLKGGIYGLFSYAVNIKLVNVQGKDMRCLETRPTSNVVAKVRAPLLEQPKANIIYDLATVDRGIDYVVKELRLEGA